MERCCQGIVAASFREGDNAEERRRKGVWVPIQLAMLVFFVATTTWQVVTGREPPRASTLGSCLGLAISMSSLLWPLATGGLSLHFVGTQLLGLAVAVLLMDLTLAAEAITARTWNFVVLIMDMFLALNAPHTYQRATLCITTIWITATAVERGFRLGLFDIDGFSEGGEEVEDACQCGNPPCAEGAVSLLSIGGGLLIFLGDYYATRRFAEGLRREQAMVVASVQVAEQVAAGLANFDLDEARAALHEAGAGLPPGLGSSFTRLIGNLASYKPYLPGVLFCSADMAVEHTGARSFSSSSSESAESGPTHWCASAGCNSPSRSRSAEPRNDCSVRSGSTGDEHPGIRPGSRGAARPSVGLARAPTDRRVTLLLCNASGLLAAPWCDDEGTAAWLGEEVERFSSIVKHQGGVTDLLSGDHHSAHFGAIQVQGSQRASATRAATQLAAAEGSLPRRSAVCAGRALCGDFGSAAAQRFMVIGAVSSFVWTVERAATAWGVAVLLDSAVQADVEQLWSCRLRKVVRFPKHTRRVVGVWEVMAERLGRGQGAEWMYELERAKANPWQLYNGVVHSWCDVGKIPTQDLAEALADAEAAQCAGADGSTSRCDRDVAEALLALEQCAQDDAPPPLGDFSALAFAGDPAPLQRSTCAV